jgi:hypothetical protein
MSKALAPFVLEGGEGGVLAEDLGRGFVGEGLGKAHPPGHRGDDPPVRARLPRRCGEGPLAGDPPLGVGHGAVLLAPARGGQQDVGAGGGVGLGGHVGDDDEVAGGERRAHPVRVREAHRGIGGHHPEGLDAARLQGPEEVHRLEAGRAGNAWCRPKASDPIDVRRREVHVGRELVGEPPDLPTAHGVGLPGDREGSHAGAADAPGGEVAVDDGVDLVGAEGPLVDALGEEGHHPLGAGEGAKEVGNGLLREAAAGGHRGNGSGLGPGGGEGRGEPLGVVLEEAPVDGVLPAQVVEQAVEEQGVRPRGEGQVAIGDVAGGGSARVDHHHPHPGPLALGAPDALEDHGWHQAVLEPTRMSRSACSRSS